MCAVFLFFFILFDKQKEHYVCGVLYMERICTRGAFIGFLLNNLYVCGWMVAVCEGKSNSRQKIQGKKADTF